MPDLLGWVPADQWLTARETEREQQPDTGTGSPPPGLYAYRGDQPEPDAVAAACRRHRLVTAAIKRRLDALEAQAAARQDPGGHRQDHPLT